MLYYKRRIGVTSEEFNTCQEEIKNAMRKMVDEYKNSFLKNFPFTGVDYGVSLKGENLQSLYKFYFKKAVEGENDAVFAELIIEIIIMDSEDKTD